MSTNFPGRLAGSLGVVALSALWLVACATAWDKSTSSGGEQEAEAIRIVNLVDNSKRLSPACTMLAQDLVHAGIKARVADRRPTRALLKHAEREQAALYMLAQCPEALIPGLSYGMAESAHRQTRLLIADNYGR